MAVVIVRLLFSGYDPYSVFAFISPGRPANRALAIFDTFRRDPPVELAALTAASPICGG
jgi:hypothetical protein